MTDSLISFAQWLQEAAPVMFAVAFVCAVVYGALKAYSSALERGARICREGGESAVKTFKEGLDFRQP